jgi:hypothetical protein
MRLPFVLLFMFILVSGCSSASTSTSGPLPLDLPPDVAAELMTTPNEPVAGEPTIVRITLLDDTKPRNGMRIELRDNTRDTRLYEAEEKIVNEQLTYEVEAIFEQSGENLITYHFNMDNYHVMSSFTIEVK